MTQISRIASNASPVRAWSARQRDRHRSDHSRAVSEVGDVRRTRDPCLRGRSESPARGGQDPSIRQPSASRCHDPAGEWKFRVRLVARACAPGASPLGIRAVVAESFAEIFFGNSVTIGLPCLTASPADLERLMAAADANPTGQFAIDLGMLRLTGDGLDVPLTMPRSAQESFLSGDWDATSLLLANYEEVERTARDGCRSLGDGVCTRTLCRAHKPTDSKAEHHNFDFGLAGGRTLAGMDQRLVIFDTTLRDGEQAPGFSMRVDEKPDGQAARSAGRGHPRSRVPDCLGGRR